MPTVEKRKLLLCIHIFRFFLFILFQSEAQNKQYIRIPAVELHTPTDIAEKKISYIKPKFENLAKLKINPLNSHLLPFSVVQVLQKCGTFSVLFNLTP